MSHSQLPEELVQSVRKHVVERGKKLNVGHPETGTYLTIVLKENVILCKWTDWHLCLGYSDVKEIFCDFCHTSELSMVLLCL